MGSQFAQAIRNFYEAKHVLIKLLRKQNVLKLFYNHIAGLQIIPHGRFAQIRAERCGENIDMSWYSGVTFG
jgi:hypothetical protein